jgi:Type IV secretion-system coupling protein DNA-binding domain/TraM recognition site of TraD and TraG
MRPRSVHSVIYTRARAQDHVHWHGRRSETVAHLLQNPDAPLHSLGRAASRVGEALVPLAPWLALAGVTAAVLARLAFGLRERRLAHGARVIEIGVPPELDEKAALTLWSALHDLLRPPWRRLLSGQPNISWEIAADQKGTRFRLWTPRAIPPGLLERAIASAWPGASAGAGVDEPPIPKPGVARITTELTLSGPEWFALSSEVRPDPLALILGQLAGLTGTERALVQVIARPATGREQHKLRAAARRIRRGELTALLARIARAISTRPPAPPRLDPTVSPDVREVMQKSSGQLYRCLIRVTVTSTSRKAARGRIHAILGAFAPYNGSRVWLRRRRTRHAINALRVRRLGRRAFLVGVPELAALAHLPEAQGIPGVARAAARRVAPPPALPREGRPLGEADAGPSRPVAVRVADARQHLHVLGATGAGKSTALAQLVLADAQAGRGAVVIDPKGDLVDWILARLERVPAPLVVIDPERSERPVGLNVLHGPDPQLAAEHLVGTFRRMYEQFWGPRTDDILRACVLTLARDPRLTLAEIPTCLSNAAWRGPLTAGLAKDDPVLAGFWRWYDELSEASRVQAIGPLLNKLRAFLLRKTVRTIVGQEQTSLPLTDVLDHGLLLARVPKGTLGEDTSRLLGGLLVARVWQEALRRSRLPESERPDSCLYVDEVHNYLALPHSFEDLLAEARGYRLSLCLAHQNLTQLPRAMADALSANARTKLIFNCSPEDARALERHVTPELTAHDLSNLARHQAACRTLSDGETLPAFTLVTRSLEEGEPDRALRLRAVAEQRFGSDPRSVERRLRARQLRVLPGGRDAASKSPPDSPTGSPPGSPPAPSVGEAAA